MLRVRNVQTTKEPKGMGKLVDQTLVMKDKNFFKLELVKTVRTILEPLMIKNFVSQMSALRLKNF